ncbi:MAG: hypothetical protein JW816_02515 [Candidatus Buchananbacteria bacterium]|nr:hypothetical protein [Candidatus Buchananbacteria bacterium]
MPEYDKPLIVPEALKPIERINLDIAEQATQALDILKKSGISSIVDIQETKKDWFISLAEMVLQQYTDIDQLTGPDDKQALTLAKDIIDNLKK